MLDDANVNIYSNFDQAADINMIWPSAEPAKILPLSGVINNSGTINFPRGKIYKLMRPASSNTIKVIKSDGS